MKKRYNTIATLVLAVLVTVWSAALVNGADMRRLLGHEAAMNQATHVIELNDEDLTETLISAAQTNLIAIAANSVVKVKRLSLVQVFNENDSVLTESCLVEFGDQLDPNRYITSTEVNSDGTEVFVKAPAVATFVAYTEATNLQVTTTPIAASAVVSNVQGRVRIYLDLFTHGLE